MGNHVPLLVDLGHCNALVGRSLGLAQAEEQRRREDEALLLHHVEQQDAVARLNALTEDMRHAVLADAELSRREARVAWRLRRWDLFSSRRTRLQVLLLRGLMRFGRLQQSLPRLAASICFCTPGVSVVLAVYIS
jgi:hypothetical protein